MPEQLNAVVQNLQGFRPPPAGADGRGDRAGARRHRRRLRLSQPPGLRDALCRARAVRREPDRPGARRGRHRLRRRLRRHHRAGAGRHDRAGAHAARREGPADQRQCRLRAVRQCRLARPDLLHAADDPRARAGRRDRPHHPVDLGHQGGARPHRHVRARQLPPRRAEAVRVRGHPLHRAWTRRRSAMSIRYLVAAAVPGLNAEEVTVLDSSGTLLAAGDDPNNTSASRSLGVERTVETQIEDNIRRALAPYLGPDNFRASVKAEVNTDTRQTEETIFDPESRVERSIQVVRANENNSQQSAGTPASVEQNLPEADPTATGGTAILRAERAQGRDHQLRDELEAHRHGQQRLHGDQDVDRRRRQPAAAGRDPRRRRHARSRSPRASPRSRSWSPPRPASARRAATSSTSRRSSSSTGSTARRSTSPACSPPSASMPAR